MKCWAKVFFASFLLAIAGALLYSWLCPEPEEEYIILEHYGNA